MRSVADYLQHCEPNVPVFVVSGFMCLPLDYYCGASREIYAVNDVVGNRESLDRVLAAMRELAGHGGRYLVVYSREFYGDPDALLLTALDHTGSVRQVFKAPGVVVYHGKFAMPVAID